MKTFQPGVTFNFLIFYFSRNLRLSRQYGGDRKKNLLFGKLFEGGIGACFFAASNFDHYVLNFTNLLSCEVSLEASNETLQQYMNIKGQKTHLQCEIYERSLKLNNFPLNCCCSSQIECCNLKLIGEIAYRILH